MLRLYFFFFNDTATTEIYTLSLHDALPICSGCEGAEGRRRAPGGEPERRDRGADRDEEGGRDEDAVIIRSEEHTSELQSRQYLVCRLLLEKKNRRTQHNARSHLYRRLQSVC